MHILVKLLIVFLLFIFYSCKENTKLPFEIKNFQPLSNFNTDSNKTASYYLDYNNAIDSGFVIPSIKNISEGAFICSFYIKNNLKHPAEFAFKIYYQNESYAFPLTIINERGREVEHPYSHENFYGSWDNNEITFLSTGIIPADGKYHKVEARFKINGNPRNEQLYYGHVHEDKYLSERAVDKAKEAVMNTPEWIESIKAKAAENKVSFEEQLDSDSRFTVLSNRNQTTFNNRWKRNPRTGVYSFMLTVLSPEAISSIPDEIKDISLRNEKGIFTNPYYYFKYINQEHNLIQYTIASNLIHVKAKPDFSKGIYFNTKEKIEDNYNTEYFNQNCSNDSIMYHNAHIQQFFHKVDRNDIFYNIPIFADVTNNEFSMQNYYENANTAHKDRIKTNVEVSDCPCKTVKYNSENNTIIIKNPAATKENPRKENVGILTRHGLTYGKYRVKVNLTSLLNDDLVWNGLTNAIWLFSENSEAEWNNRRICNNKGYIPKHLEGPDAERVKSTAYSEIDFEILKANRYYPSTSYPNLVETPKEGPEDRDKIIVTCTNWDLACADAKNFGVGYYEFENNGKLWGVHRWDNYYQAITSKHVEPEKDLFDVPYYYFEIEWKPEEIIWRIGPEKDKMKIVGYMNKDVTNIPNNQMLLAITQEFHNSWWWPEMPQLQENIPFPSKDIIGEILEIEIE